MLTKEQIEDQVNREDIIPYHNGVYDDNLPWSIVEQFRIAMMHLPPTAHRYPMEEVKIMSERSPNEVTRKELGMMINVIYAIPFASMYETLEEGIEKTMEFDKIREEYNRQGEAFTRKVEAKKRRLLNFSGNNNNSVPMPKNLLRK